MKPAVRHACTLTLGLALALAGGLPARAFEVPGYPPSVEAYDPREVGKLPAYCIYTDSFRDRVPGGKNSLEIERWRSFMGVTFDAMHHYCWGLMKTNRAVLLAVPQAVRDFYLNDAITEYDYVLRHATDEFILLPEILTKKGENLIRLGKGQVAVLHLERAAALKPDYWPPYAHLSDYYKSAGDIDKAQSYLEKGLSFSPDAIALKRRLLELGGATSGKRGAARPAAPH